MQQRHVIFIYFPSNAYSVGCLYKSTEFHCRMVERLQECGNLDKLLLRHPVLGKCVFRGLQGREKNTPTYTYP